MHLQQAIVSDFSRARLSKGVDDFYEAPLTHFKDLDTAKGFLRGSHSWGEAGFEPGTSALRRPDATTALLVTPLYRGLLRYPWSMSSKNLLAFIVVTQFVN